MCVVNHVVEAGASGMYTSAPPTAVSGSGHTCKTDQFTGRCYAYATKSASQAVLSGMQLTLEATTRRTPHGALRFWCRRFALLVQVMSAWSVQTRRAPSRYCRDTRVYGHTTTAMHGNEYTPPHPVGAAGPWP